jgi:APA family basic amino acid/polyamine antiporter
VAKKVEGLRRVLDPTSIAAVAYGEIGSSIFFALGVVALQALGFTPWVLLAAGLLFTLVAVSYAEGTAAIPETGGAATFVRRAFNDPAGFVTGWVLFLDYLIVIALAGLFVAHYIGQAVGWEALTDSPWDVIAAIGVIVLLGLVRLVRRTNLYRLAVVVAGLAFVAHFLIVGLGFAFLFSSDALSRGVDLGRAPTWSSIAFALPLAMLAYTGLETVANLAAEAREPGRTLPRSLFAGIGLAVLMSVAIGIVGVSAFPAHADPAGPGGFATDLGTTWIRAPIVGIATAFGGELPALAVDVLRIFLGLSACVILLAAVSTSISGVGRLAYSLGQHGMLPHAFGRLSKRTLIAPPSIVAAVLFSSALLLAAVLVGGAVRFLASLYSFGVLVAFTAAQLAVIRLRFSDPELERPFRALVNVSVRGTPVPLAALIGAPLTFLIWIAALLTHDAARIAGPIWVLLGFAVFATVRRSRGETMLERVEPAYPDLVPEVEGLYERILVPLKLGSIGEEVLATAIRLAEEQGCPVRVLNVIPVPLELPLDAELGEREENAEAALAEARSLAAEHGIAVEGDIVRARSIGAAIVEHAQEESADLIVMGSAPRWRRQSRFFSPTVDYVLRRAHCEVMVVAYPQGVLEETTVEP